jgi:hypothetical protein
MLLMVLQLAVLSRAKAVPLVTSSAVPVELTTKVVSMARGCDVN